MKTKTKKLDFAKITNVCSMKHTVKKTKTTPQMRTIFTNHLFNKGLVPKNYNELQQDHFLNWQKN